MSEKKSRYKVEIENDLSSISNRTYVCYEWIFDREHRFIEMFRSDVNGELVAAISLHPTDRLIIKGI